MGRASTKLFFSLLHSALCNTKLSEEEKAALSKEHIEKLLSLAEKHDVSHLLVWALKQNGLLTKEDSDKEKSILMAIYRCEKLKYALSELSEVLEKEKIPYIPLKGSVLRSYYPEEWMRTSCDIDLLVHEEDLNRAAEAIVNTLQYQTDGKRDYHDLSLYSSNGVHLELHHNIQENMDNIDRLLSHVWEYAYRENPDGFRYRQTPEFFMFHHIAHMSYHFVGGGCGIRPFLDLYILQEKMEFDDTTVRAYCEQCGIGKFYEQIRYLADVWFGKEEHTELSQKMERYVLSGGVYGALANRISAQQGKKGGKVGYLLSRIFLPYDSLKYYYPILTKYKWLYPAMQVRRWGRLLFGGRLRRSVNELQVNARLTKEQAESVQSFLEELGL